MKTIRELNELFGFDKDCPNDDPAFPPDYEEVEQQVYGKRPPFRFPQLVLSIIYIILWVICLSAFLGIIAAIFIAIKTIFGL